jgi:hypothetical protein
MQRDLELTLGKGLHMRTLVADDAALLAEATSGESEPALWGAVPQDPIRCTTGKLHCRHGIPLQGVSSPLESCTASSSSARSG